MLLSAPKVLYNKYIKFEEELLAYGIEVIDDLNMISIESKDEKVSFSGIKEEISKNLCLCSENKVEGKKDLDTTAIADEFTINLSNKKLVSESDLRKPQEYKLSYLLKAFLKQNFLHLLYMFLELCC